MENKPDWKKYFMGLAFLVASRSIDPSTKHGCIIVDENNHILGSGYNGPIKGINDSKIPLTRPEKYPFMRHSEENAIHNCNLSPFLFKNPVAYVTGQVCNECFQKLHQVGIKKIIMANRTSHMLNEETQKMFNFLLEETKMEIEYIDFDSNWIIDYFQQFKK